MQAHSVPQAPPPQQFHAALPPSIPRKDIQALIPRLSTTINDIDTFKASLAAGYQDGSLPNWDSLLSRYSVLLARISSLSQTISALPPPPALRPGAPKPASASVPVLARYLVHPLRPLPIPSLSTAAAGAVPTGPPAEEVFIQAINTQLRPSLLESSASLLSSHPTEGKSGQEEGQGEGSGEGWVPLEVLRKMPDRELDELILELRGRMERESVRTERIREAVKRAEEGVEWGMSVEGGAEDGEDDDELFRDEEDTAAPPKAAVPPPNPREGWSLPDYLKFMETGQAPSHFAAPPPPAGSGTGKPDVIDLT